MKKEIFVFGSNLAGRHGAGSAFHARQQHGAIQGQGEGLQGNSYAIPTKDNRLRRLPLSEISLHIKKFIDFAWKHPELEFDIVSIGCGLAGYKREDIEPMFRYAPDNCKFREFFK